MADAAIIVKERPMPFHQRSVLGLLADRKTQTRRVVKWKPLTPGLNLAFSGMMLDRLTPTTYALVSRDGAGCWNQRTEAITCPYGQPGHRLWVKETFRVSLTDPEQPWLSDSLDYQADGATRNFADDGYVFTLRRENPRKWVSSRYMPRWASRILLEITSVKVERVRSISEEDAYAEGIEPSTDPQTFSPIVRYGEQWNVTNAHRKGCRWEDNPWVWAIAFKRIA